MSNIDEMRPQWCKEPCWECGIEGYATRTERRPKSEPYICETCEVSARAHEEHQAALAALRAEVKRWKAKYIEARQSGYAEGREEAAADLSAELDTLRAENEQLKAELAAHHDADGMLASQLEAAQLAIDEGKAWRQRCEQAEGELEVLRKNEEFWRSECRRRVPAFVLRERSRELRMRSYELEPLASASLSRAADELDRIADTAGDAEAVERAAFELVGKLLHESNAVRVSLPYEGRFIISARKHGYPTESSEVEFYDAYRALAGKGGEGDGDG